MSNIENEWIRWEVYLVQSSPSTMDGQFRVWQHRPNAGSPPAVSNCINSTAAQTRSTSDAWNQLMVGAYMDVSPTGADSYAYIDDVYVDNTLAHVEICDSSAWASRKRCEVQVPSAWSATSITATVNRASFGAADNAYLYVVDSAGAVNPSGHAITFGDSIAVGALTGGISGGAIFGGKIQ